MPSREQVNRLSAGAPTGIARRLPPRSSVTSASASVSPSSYSTGGAASAASTKANPLPGSRASRRSRVNSLAAPPATAVAPILPLPVSHLLRAGCCRSRLREYERCSAPAPGRRARHGVEMRASSPFRLAACLIVIAASGCDNVQWGGAELAFVPPPPKEQEAGPADEEPGEDRLPEGPLLHLVHAQGGGIGTLVPIAEISGDSLRRLEADDWERYGNRLIAEHYRAGDELALFRAGARVGTFIIQSAEVPPESVCPRVPRVTGIMELDPGAGDATEFLALRKTDAPAPPRPAAAPQPTRAMQVLAPILAERLLRGRSAPLPGNWQRAIAQLTPIPIAGSAEPGRAAAFLVGDTLGPGLDDAGSSLFFVATPQAQSGYEPVFAEYND